MEIVSKNMESVEEVKEANVGEIQQNNESQQERTMPTYEQLKNWCDQLLAQRNQLAERLGQITDIHTKLPWLFKVIENKEVFNSEFVDSCVDEVTYILTPPNEPDVKEETKE